MEPAFPLASQAYTGQNLPSTAPHGRAEFWEVLQHLPLPPPPTPPPTPPTPPPPPPQQCSASYSDNCLRKPRCCNPAMTCFMKDSDYGQCLPFCIPGIHWNDPPRYQTPWACTPVGGSGPSPAPPPPTTTAPPAPPPPPTPPPSPSPSPPTPSPTPAPGTAACWVR